MILDWNAVNSPLLAVDIDASVKPTVKRTDSSR